MENSEEANEEVPFPQLPAEEDHDDNDEINEQEDDDDDDDDDDDIVVSVEANQRNLQSQLSRLREQKFKLETLSRHLKSELVPIRVHNVLIRGNTKTKDWVIEAELKGIENATTVQQLIAASEVALARLQRLGIFSSTKLSLEAGPPELPNTANVVIDVVETDNKVSGGFGFYTKPAVQSHFLFTSYLIYWEFGLL